MDFHVIPSSVEERFSEIRRRIRRLQSGGTIDSLKNIGADIRNQIGASYVSLKQLATHYQPDERLALLLWNTKKREEQIISCFLLPSNINREKITQLSSACLNNEVAGYWGSIFLYQYPQLKEMIDDWLKSEHPIQQVAILTAMARHLMVYKTESIITPSQFQQAISRHYKDKGVQLVAERYRFNN